MIHYLQCPVCKGDSIREVFFSTDHTVSNEQYAIWECRDCSLRFTQNVPAEDAIGAYYASPAYISHTDSQEGLVNRMYHLVRRRTLASKASLIRKETGRQRGNILDLGCGTGAFLHFMKQRQWNATGIEPDETARLKAKALYNLEPLPAKAFFTLPGPFDAISLWHVLEHVHQLHIYIEKLGSLLSVTGKLFIAVPNYTSHDASHYGNRWAAYDVPRHLYHFSPASMKKLLDLHGLRICRTVPMWFDSFYVSMLSEQHKNNKGNLIKAFYEGLRSNITTLGNSEKCSSLVYVVAKK